MNAMQVLALLLALSVAGNGALGYVYLGERDARVAADQARSMAVDAATSCTASITTLQDEADARAMRAIPALAAAQARALSAQQRAQQILSTPASVPGDDCQSARERAALWLQGRAQP